MSQFKIVAISDTHNRHNKIVIPECDFLIHAGDWSGHGDKHEVEAFATWMNAQTQARHIVLIPGNHEKTFEKFMPDSLKWFTDICPRAHLLIDQAVTIEGINFYGSPVQPFFFNWAWNRARGHLRRMENCGYGKMKPAEPIVPHWKAIPDNTHILITHGPPYGILDQTSYADGTLRDEHLGCMDLMDRIKQLKELDLHIFGHIHTPGGTQVHKDGVSYYNAAICDETYFPGNPITVIDYVR
jgi:Icc-related predicted phosphoesterase